MQTDADFDIIFEDGVPMGYARTPSGVAAFGSRPVHMLQLDAEHFWANIPSTLLVAVIDDVGGVHYPSKNSLQ